MKESLKFVPPLVVGIVGIYLIAAGMAPGVITTYDVRAEIVSSNPENMTVGASVDSDLIDFGRIPSRVIEARKEVAVSNNENHGVRVTAELEGNISEILVLENVPLHLRPGEEGNIAVVLETSEEAQTGLYSGSLEINSRRSFGGR